MSGRECHGEQKSQLSESQSISWFTTMNALKCLTYFQGRVLTPGENVLSQCLIDYVPSNIAISFKLLFGQ